MITRQCNDRPADQQASGLSGVGRRYERRGIPRKGVPVSACFGEAEPRGPRRAFLRPMHEITELSRNDPPTPTRGPLSVVPDAPAPAADSYRRLAHVFHEVLSEQSLDSLLERIADTLADLIPHDSMTIYEADETHRVLRPVLARDPWAEKIMASHSRYGQGITGW